MAAAAIRSIESSHYPTIRAVCALLLMTIAGSSMYASIMVLEPAAREFDAGRGAAALPYTLYMLGFGVGNIAMGWLADRIGIMWPTVIGCACLPLGFSLASMAPDLISLSLTLCLLCGLLGASFSFAPMVADISHWFTGRRGLAVGIVISGSYFAGAIWPPILQYWFDTDGWRETFMLLAYVTALTIPLLGIGLLMPTPQLTDSDAQERVPMRPLGFSRSGLHTCLCAAGLGCCVAMSMPQVHIVPYVTDLGFDAIRGAEMMSIMLGCGIISRIGFGWISDRIGGLKTLILGSVLQALVLVGWMFAQTLPVMYLTSVAFGLAQGGIVPAYTIVIRRYFPPRESGWRIGSTIMFTVGGMSLGGWMAGALYDLSGDYTLSFINAIVFNGINLAIAALLLRRARNQSSS